MKRKNFFFLGALIFAVLLLTPFVVVPQVVPFPSLAISVKREDRIGEYLIPFDILVINTGSVPTVLSNISLAVSALKPEYMSVEDSTKHIDSLRSAANSAGRSFKGIVYVYTLATGMIKDALDRMKRITIDPSSPLYSVVVATLQAQLRVGESMLRGIVDSFGPTQNDWLSKTFYSSNVTSKIASSEDAHVLIQREDTYTELGPSKSLKLRVTCRAGDRLIAMRGFLEGCEDADTFVPEDFHLALARLEIKLYNLLNDLTVVLFFDVKPATYGLGFFYIFTGTKRMELKAKPGP